MYTILASFKHVIEHDDALLWAYAAALLIACFTCDHSQGSAPLHPHHNAWHLPQIELQHKTQNTSGPETSCHVQL